MIEPLALPEPTEDPPAGPNMETRADFLEMERTAQGKPETQYGNVIEAAVPPDWKLTATMASALLERTRDLRIMVLLTIANVHLVGFTAYAQGLATIRVHLETMWKEVHPQLDPEDDNDPMQRANTLQALQDRVLRPMRDIPLANTPRTGPVTWRDLAVLNGTLEPESGREKMSEAAIRAAFAGTDKARLADLNEAIDSALADLVAIP
jgi:type VI secretion system protein ImpA